MWPKLGSSLTFLSAHVGAIRLMVCCVSDELHEDALSCVSSESGMSWNRTAVLSDAARITYTSRGWRLNSLKCIICLQGVMCGLQTSFVSPTVLASTTSSLVLPTKLISSVSRRVSFVVRTMCRVAICWYILICWYPTAPLIVSFRRGCAIQVVWAFVCAEVVDFSLLLRAGVF